MDVILARQQERNSQSRNGWDVYAPHRARVMSLLAGDDLGAQRAREDRRWADSLKQAPGRSGRGKICVWVPGTVMIWIFQVWPPYLKKSIWPTSMPRHSSLEPHNKTLRTTIEFTCTAPSM